MIMKLISNRRVFGALVVVLSAVCIFLVINSMGLIPNDPSQARQRASIFASKEFNADISPDSIELVDDGAHWKFHIATSSDMVAGCGSLWNQYSISKSNYRIKDISYRVDGPC